MQCDVHLSRGEQPRCDRFAGWLSFCLGHEKPDNFVAGASPEQNRHSSGKHGNAWRLSLPFEPRNSRKAALITAIQHEALKSILIYPENSNSMHEMKSTQCSRAFYPHSLYRGQSASAEKSTSWHPSGVER